MSGATLKCETTDGDGMSHTDDGESTLNWRVYIGAIIVTLHRCAGLSENLTNCWTSGAPWYIRASKVAL